MAQPTLLGATNAAAIDTLYALDGTPLLKGAVVGVSPTGITPKIGWAWVATHADGATFNVGADGISVAAGVSGGIAVPLLVDASGRVLVTGDPASVPVPVQVTPPGTAVDDSQTGAAGAIAATLAGVGGKTTYITGFQVTGGGATADSIITVTVTGPSTVQSYKLAVPAGVTVGALPLIVTFPTPVPASAPNTAIVVDVPSFGAGNTDAAVAAQGFQL